MKIILGLFWNKNTESVQNILAKLFGGADEMKRKFRYGNIYLALGICVVAVAVAAVISLTPSKGGTLEEDGFSRVSISWNESIFYETVPETDAVDIDVTGVPDLRVTAEIEETEAKREKSFALPMGNHVIKDYSNGEMVFSKTMGDWRIHNGVDFGGASGNSVGAVEDGIITSVYDDSFWGTVVEIDHGDGMLVRYCGLKKGSTLPDGARVTRGEKIGTLGSIPVESGDGDHLHIEISIDGKTVDPLEALGKIREE